MDRHLGMDLGAFSLSLAVSNLSVSRAFYEKLGFTATGGEADQGWLIMNNGTTVIGLFQGMFEKNILTFNPGWDSDAKEVNPFTDIRELQERLEAAGVELGDRVKPGKRDGPAHITLVDPDGNPILIDQHR